MGFFSLPAYGPADASGLDMTWFVTTTAMPNYKIVSFSIEHLYYIYTSSASR